MKKSLRQLTKDYLEHFYPNFVHRGELERKAINEWDYEGSNISRRCRELENEGIIEKKLDAKRRVWYRYKKDIVQEKKQNNLTYDEQLKNILLVISPAWNNTDKIKEIEKAIISNSEYYKRTIIEKYK